MVLYLPTMNDNNNIEKIRLDPNHTHFIFCDDGSIDGDHQTEIKFRNKFDSFLRDNIKINGTKMVLIVIEGDLETLKKINASLAEGIRVLVLAVRIIKIHFKAKLLFFIQGTNGCADFIAYYLTNKKRSVFICYTK